MLDARAWSGPVARWAIDPGSAPAPRLSYWFTRGCAAARAGDGAAARDALVAYDAAAHDVRAAIDSEGPTPSPDDREFLSRAEVLRLELVGLIAAGRGDRAAALDTLRRATAVEDGMAYAFGPPYVNEPAHELLGEELLAAGQPARAQHEFELALTRTPGRTSVLLGLARAARATGDSAAATGALAKLAAIWHAADPDLPGLSEARAHRP